MGLWGQGVAVAEKGDECGLAAGVRFSLVFFVIVIVVVVVVIVVVFVFAGGKSFG